MRKVVESTFVSLDGTISDPQEWSPPYWDDEHAGYAERLMSSTDALLLGRATYEGFTESWPGRGGDYADKVNVMPKHVASRTLTETTWNATLLGEDVPGAVAKLKQEPGEDILKFGTGELDRTLIEHDLVDEFHFWFFPVLVGGGQRLIDGIDVTHLALADSTRFKSGIVVNVYEPKSD